MNAENVETAPASRTTLQQRSEEHLRDQAALREESRLLELLNQTGQSIASQLEIDKLLQTVTDAATELTGARFGAFFYNGIDAQGEAYLLYTLSGAPRESFEKFGHPRPTALFGPTFQGRSSHPQRRCHPGPPVRNHGAASRHAARSSAGAELPGGGGEIAIGRSVGRTLLRPPGAGQIQRA
jgi:GAF domain-containing protein